MNLHVQDVYAEVSLNGKPQRTKVDVKGGQHPVWDDELRFPVYRDSGGKSRKLEVACYSKEARKDDCIGQGGVDIGETLQTGEFDGERSICVCMSLRQFCLNFNSFLCAQIGSSSRRIINTKARYTLR